MTDSFRDTATKIVKAAEPCIAPHECPGLEAALAAAIRELADQVMPKPIGLLFNSYAEGAYDQRIHDRQRLLAIATELEGCKK